MIKESQNKQMKTDEVKQKSVDQTQQFFFPEHGVTIEATSIEEAEQKLQIIKKK